MNKSKETKGSEQAALHMKKISQLKYEQRETDWLPVGMNRDYRKP